MMTPSTNIKLLQQVLASAVASGVDQKQLASEAGLKPESLSRAKKRPDMGLNTLSRLASVVGLEVVLVPSRNAVAPFRKKTPPRQASLAAPHFGLSWSNPSADEGALLRNALVKARFDAILESAAVDGVDFVRQQMQLLREAGEIDSVKELKLEGIVKSIERGFMEATCAAASR